MRVLRKPNDATETVAVNATGRGLGKPVRETLERKDYASVRDTFANAMAAASTMENAGYCVNVTARAQGAPWTLLAVNSGR